MFLESSPIKDQPIESALTKLDKIIASCEKSRNRNAVLCSILQKYFHQDKKCNRE
ncbi:hypothetical protein MYP_4965 [Sporocytophaga myxococcoides]|uniref:Uncharacterized protein n=1 Tax=Sporocytophaga myxococcoides TaxID=153721 RepID=A0A098LMN8_9BACT|nr:hypothetical protein MYP_4965 [Sporocytophaga myxococcoides]